MPDIFDLEPLARDVAVGLRRTGRQLVTAESCTAGLVAALLGGVPGISAHFCGAAVVYQEATKTAWLAVPTDVLAEYGAVSAEVATLMTAGVLEQTPHANLAVAVTGHLGPQAPPDLDGVVFIAVQDRGQPAQFERHQLPPSRRTNDTAARIERQRLGAQLVLERLFAYLT